MIPEIGQTVRRVEYDRLTAPMQITNQKELEHVLALMSKGMQYEIEK